MNTDDDMKDNHETPDVPTVEDRDPDDEKSKREISDIIDKYWQIEMRTWETWFKKVKNYETQDPTCHVNVFISGTEKCC